MKNTLLTSSILAALNLATSLAFANESDTLDDHILVTANRTQQDGYLALSSNQVITREQIEQLQVVSVADILKTVAGIHVANQGDAGQLTSVYTRGTNSNHTLVLVDGVRVGSATLGRASFSAMSAQHIERIEIVKGPRAALWGSDAIGGVIQIFTKRYANGEGNISIGGGNNGFLQGAASLGFGNQQHQYTVNVSTESSDGFNAYTSDPNNPYDINEPDADGYRRRTVSLTGSSELNAQLSLNIVGQWQSGNNDFDASYPDYPCWDDPSKACPNYYANKQQSENYHLKVSGLYHTDNASLELTAARSQDQAETYGNGIKKGDADRIETVRDQISVLGNYQFATETGVTIGADWYQESVSTNTDKVSWVPGFQSWDVDQRTVNALFVQGRHQVSAWLFEAAARYDSIENIDNEVTYNASVGYQFSDAWLVSVNSGSGFKAPTFNDLYWPGSGNPELHSENSTTHEILLRRNAEHSVLEVSVYDSDVDDLIAWSPDASGSWKPSNINQASMQGVDLSYSANVGDFDYQLALAYVDTEDKSTGDALLRRPKFTADYQLNYHWQDWQFGTVVSYRDKSKDSGGVDLDSYWLVDLMSTYQINQHFSVAAKVVNAFNRRYQSALNYRADETSYRVSLSYAF